MSEEKPKPPKLHLIEHKGAYLWNITDTEGLADFQCREDDVWVCSYPRSGTTLTQQTVYLIMTLDFEKAVTVDLDDRFPLADFLDDSYPYFRGLRYLDSMPTSEPRMIKSHFHHYLLPDQLRKGKGKIVYITRNPKASVVSMYKFLNYLNQQLTQTLDEYVERFLTQKDVVNCPWGLHVREFWERRNEPNILFLQFEKVLKDRRGTIKKIAEFLGRDLTEEQVDKILDYTRLESMKNNKTCTLRYIENMYETDTSDSAFINKGEISGWRKDLSDDLIQKMDDLIQSELKDTDIVY